MEDDLRPETPQDLAAGDELTRWSSDSSSSSVTVENSKDTFRQSANTRQVKCTDWTDEKHKLYLDHLEASFVDQLHRSMGLLAWCSEQNICDPSPSPRMPGNTCNDSEQFTVLQNGCRRKINYESNNPPFDCAADPHFVSRNSWIRRFRSAEKSCTRTSTDLQKCNSLTSRELNVNGKKSLCLRFATGSEQISVNRPCHQAPSSSCTGGPAEVSDQNFLDGDHEDKLNSLSMAKRLKAAVTDDSDQIVPLGKFDGTEISTLSGTPFDCKEQRCQEWPSENLESYVFPQPNDVKSFLRKS